MSVWIGNPAYRLDRLQWVTLAWFGAEWNPPHLQGEGESFYWSFFMLTQALGFNRCIMGYQCHAIRLNYGNHRFESNKMNHEAPSDKCLKPLKTNLTPPIDSTHGGFPMDIPSVRLWVTGLWCLNVNVLYLDTCQYYHTQRPLTITRTLVWIGFKGGTKSSIECQIHEENWSRRPWSKQTLNLKPTLQIYVP